MSSSEGEVVSVLYIDNLPTQDEGHDLKWSYVQEKVEWVDRFTNQRQTGHQRYIILTTEFGEWKRKANFGPQHLTETIKGLIVEKRNKWRELLLAEGPVELLPTPPNTQGVYRYEE